DDETVYQVLRRATLALPRAWNKLKAAQRIAIKFNQDFRSERVPYFEGMREQLVSDKVARAVVRLLREETDAELVYADITAFARTDDPNPPPTAQMAALMAGLNVGYVNGDRPPHKIYQVPGGGQMFRQYLLPQEVVEADALVDVQKMKNHAFMGVTLALKNLFGLVPREPHGRSRQYFHHLVRMPYMLADIGRIFNPTLSIIDALTGQAGQEWGDGVDLGRIVNTLIAGDQVVATDAVGMTLMGHDPNANWPELPYRRDGNAVLTAAQGGFGTIDLDQIDWESEVAPQPAETFFSLATDTNERVVSWRRTTCEQALTYRDHMREFTEKYAGQYILLQDREVKWHSDDSVLRGSRRKLAGDNPDEAMWLKYVDPVEAEGEHFEVYEQTLERMRELGY
ncbi:MAG: DUF362 domain-containing protein, partial [Anaerolineae bacterium]|nr:DUF362 domain-containing protein [Anaerolineae bacterium]